MSNFHELVLKDIELLLLSQTKCLSFLLCLALVDKSSLCNLVLRTGLVLVVKAIAECGCNLLTSNRFAASCVAIFVVSDKRWGISFLGARLFDEKVDVSDDGRFYHLGPCVDVVVDLGLDEGSQFAVTRCLLRNTSLTNNDGTGSRDNS